MTRTSRAWTAIAGLSAVALTMTAAPVTTATAQGEKEPRPIEVASLGSSPDGAQSHPVQFNARGLDGAEVGDRISVGLPDGTTVAAAVNRHSSTDGITSWSGGLLGGPGGFTAVEVNGVHHLNISTAQGTFEIASNRSGAYELTKIKPREETGDDTVMPSPPQGDAKVTGAASLTGFAPTAPVAGDAASTIDIAILYPAALPATIGEAAMQAQFGLGISQLNQTLAASGIATQARLVGTAPVAAPQAATLEANYDFLRTPNDGVFDEAQTLREQTHADLVSMWFNNNPNDSCGLGSLGGTNPKYDPDSAAWTVLYAQGCATGTYTFAHEIGHNLSAQHDPGASSPPSDGKPYARGYVDTAARVRTMMAYDTVCASQGFTCRRLLNYSNPAVSVNGRVTGTASQNNAQAVAEQVAAVANYRQSQIFPGAVTIDGRARYKGTAKAATTAWTPAVSYSYQWFIDGAPVPGATSSTFKPPRRSIGKTLTLQLTGSAPYYAATPVSVSTVVGKALFKTSRPKVRGIPRAGRVLSVSVKRWKPKPAKKSVKVRYQWFKNGKKIKGARKATYRVRAKDRGKKITVRVTTKKRGYEKASRTSKRVKIRR